MTVVQEPLQASPRKMVLLLCEFLPQKLVVHSICCADCSCCFRKHQSHSVQQIEYQETLCPTNALFSRKHKGNSTRHSGPSQNRGPARYLPTRKTVLINDYSLYIILRVIVCFFDQYSMIKYAFFFIISSINHEIAPFQETRI